MPAFWRSVATIAGMLMARKLPIRHGPVLSFKKEIQSKGAKICATVVLPRRVASLDPFARAS